MTSIFPAMDKAKFWNKIPVWPVKVNGIPLFSGDLITITDGCSQKYSYSLYPFSLLQKNSEGSSSKCTDLSFRTLKPFIDLKENQERFGFSIDNNDFFVDSENELGLWLSHLKPMCIINSIEDDFVIIKEIGKGSTSTVYYSEHVETRDPFAIKSFDKKFLMKKRSGVRNLKEEINVLYKLNHERVMKLYFVYESEDFVYLVTEYLSEWNLCNYLKLNKKFKPEIVKKFICSLLETLQYIHSCGVVHRDLKLENLMVHGTNHELKIIDFGLSYGPSTLSNSKCGSPGYIAPEVFMSESYNSKIDIFSTGVILYVLLTGNHPFEGKDDWKVLENNLSVNYKLDKKLSPAAQSLIKAMLEFDPDLRPSAGELLQDPWLNEGKEIPSDLATAIVY